MTEIAAVGSDAFVLGFRLAGIRRVYPVKKEAFEEAIRDAMNDENIGILVVHSEEIAHLPSWLKKRMLDSIHPVIIQIGGHEEELRDKVKKAIGVDLYKS